VVEQAATPAKATFPVQTLTEGKAAVFSMQIANNNGAAKTYSFTLGGLQDWASKLKS